MHHIHYSQVPLNTLFAYIALCDMVSSLPALYSGYFMMAGRPKVNIITHTVYKPKVNIITQTGYKPRIMT